jgi:hypothetical protein
MSRVYSSSHEDPDVSARLLTDFLAILRQGYYEAHWPMASGSLTHRRHIIRSVEHVSNSLVVCSSAGDAVVENFGFFLLYPERRDCGDGKIIAVDDDGRGVFEFWPREDAAGLPTALEAFRQAYAILTQ